MVLTNTNVHYQEKEIPVELDTNVGGYVLRVGETYEGEITFFVKHLDQLEKFAADIQAQIQKLKQNT